MRTLILMAALIGAGGMVCGSPEARADPYRWCAIYGGDGDGGTNRGFITLEQCRATILGMGGSCEPNQFYDGKPYDGTQPIRRRKQK